MRTGVFAVLADVCRTLQLSFGLDRFRRNVRRRHWEGGVCIPVRVESFSEDLEGAELGDAEDVLLEDVEGDDLGREVVEGLQAPPAAFAQLLTIGPDFEGNKLKKRVKLCF